MAGVAALPADEVVDPDFQQEFAKSAAFTPGAGLPKRKKNFQVRVSAIVSKPELRR